MVWEVMFAGFATAGSVVFWGAGDELGSGS